MTERPAEIEQMLLPVDDIGFRDPSGVIVLDEVDEARNVFRPLRDRLLGGLSLLLPALEQVGDAQ